MYPTTAIYIRFPYEEDYEFSLWMKEEEYKPEELGFVEISRSEDILEQTIDIVAKLKDNHVPFVTQDVINKNTPKKEYHEVEIGKSYTLAEPKTYTVINKKPFLKEK